MPVAAKLVELLKFASPVRWNVLFVEPCSPGQVPVASVVQPTPVLGGKPWRRPLPAASTPLSRRFANVGSRPWSTYLCTMSCLRPSDANRIALSALPAVDAARAVDRAAEP